MKATDAYYQVTCFFLSGNSPLYHWLEVMCKWHWYYLLQFFLFDLSCYFCSCRWNSDLLFDVSASWHGCDSQSFGFFSNFICIVSYHLHKLHLLIVHFSFYTFRKWWMQQLHYNQRLNIPHTLFFYSLQLLFYFCFFQQFHFFLLPLSMVILLSFLFPCYSL